MHDSQQQRTHSSSQTNLKSLNTLRHCIISRIIHQMFDPL
jgi:hypothetical protein